MSPALQAALDGFIQQFLFPHEGEYFENDPNDDGDKGDGVTPGNIGTHYGVDARSHPGVDIENLTAAQALLIYQSEFNTSLSSALPWPLAPAFYDIHVNNGEIEAIKILQRAIGVTQDGLAGPVTMGLIAHANPAAIGIQLPSVRDQFYRDLAQEVPKDRRYLGGWLQRDADLISWIKVHGTV
jgi:lysozyme family protein